MLLKLDKFNLKLFLSVEKLGFFFEVACYFPIYLRYVVVVVK